ncbi:MAG: type 4a pilus biogenesis protein PilO [Thermoanaerobaculia bacterium]
MALVELKLEEKRWFVALTIGLSIGLALLFAGYVLWIKNVDVEIETRRAEDKSLQEQIQKGRAAERKLSQFREEVKRLELELAKLLQILPSARNTEELIKRIETLTRQGDFTLKVFKPGEPVAKDFYSEYPIDISLDGAYHNLALLFDRMSRFSRIINVEQLKLLTLENVPGKSIGASFVAKTFIYTGEGTGRAGAPGARPGAGAAGKAQTLKQRAEGRGIE